MKICSDRFGSVCYSYGMQWLQIDFSVMPSIVNISLTSFNSCPTYFELYKPFFPTLNIFPHLWLIHINNSSTPDQDGQPMWASEEEWCVLASEPLLPQGCLPLSRVWTEWGAEKEKWAGHLWPDRRLPQIFQGGLHSLDFRCTDTLLDLWWWFPSNTSLKYGISSSRCHLPPQVISPTGRWSLCGRSSERWGRGTWWDCTVASSWKVITEAASTSLSTDRRQTHWSFPWLRPCRLTHCGPCWDTLLRSVCTTGSDESHSFSRNTLS